MNFEEFLSKMKQKGGNYPTRPVNPEADNIETPQEKMADAAEESVGIDKKILDLNEQQLKVLKEIREKLVPFAASVNKEEDKGAGKANKKPLNLRNLGIGLAALAAGGPLAAGLAYAGAKKLFPGGDGSDGDGKTTAKKNVGPVVEKITDNKIDVDNLEKKIIKGVAAGTAASATAYGANRLFRGGSSTPRVEPRLTVPTETNRSGSPRTNTRVQPRLSPFERTRRELLQLDEDRKRNPQKYNRDNRGGRPTTDRDKTNQVKKEINEELKREKEEKERLKKERAARLAAEKEAKEKALKLEEDARKKKVEVKKKEIKEINDVEKKADADKDAKKKVEPQTKVDDTKTKVEPKLTQDKKVDSIVGDKKPGYQSADRVEPKLGDGSKKVDIDAGDGVGKKILKGAIKGVPVIGTAVGIGMGVSDAIEGVKQAEEILDIEGREATTSEKAAAGAGAFFEGASMGLIDKKNAAKKLLDIKESVTDYFSSDNVEPAQTRSSSGNSLGVDTNDANDMSRQLSTGGQNITNNNVTNITNNNGSSGSGGVNITPRPNNQESPIDTYQRNSSSY